MAESHWSLLPIIHLERFCNRFDRKLRIHVMKYLKKAVTSGDVNSKSLSLYWGYGVLNDFILSRVRTTLNFAYHFWLNCL